MIIYRTSAVMPPAQFGYWHEVICRHFVPARSAVDKARAFPAAFRTAPLGPFQISRLSAPRHSWARTTDNVRRAPHDEFLLSLKLKGETHLEQDGRQAQQATGEFALYDTGRPFAYLLDSDIALLKIPRNDLLARLPEASRYTATGFGLGSAVGRLAGRLMQEALELELTGNPAAAQRMGDCLVDAVAAAIEWELGAAATAGRADVSLLAAVKTYVRANLDNRGLDATHLAQRHGISVRTLNRLFARDGSTPMRWTWAQRLQACHDALARGAASRVTDVALQFGFSDPSHFSRAFKSAYGITPAGLRRRAR